jgi:hypothetical protein
MGSFLPNHFPERQVPDTGDVSLAMATAVRAASAIVPLAGLVSVLKNNVQRIGAVSTPADTVFFDSLPYALQPDVVTGSPTVHVTGSISVTGTPGAAVIVSLVRDRGTANVVVLTFQEVEIGATTQDNASHTLSFLDTIDTVDANTGAPFPLGEASIHTYSIEAVAASTLTGEVNALILMEQMLGGSSSTFPVPTPGAPVNLGTAADFASFAGAGISTTGTSEIIGDIGVDPSSSTSITGFALVLDASGQFSTSSQVVGRVFAPDYAVPTPAKVVQASTDMMAAYTDASGRTPGTTNAFAGHLGGQTLVPGVYKWTTPLEVGSAPAGNLTLNGNGVYIFIGTGTFDFFSQIVLAGGALPQNVFWAIAGAVTIHPGAIFMGELLAQTSVALQAGATVHGRLLAQTGVTLINNTITEV